MFGLLFILIALAFPFFAIYGFFSFLKFLFGGKGSKNQDFSEIISDLEAVKAKRLTVNSLIEKYRAKSNLINQFSNQNFDQKPTTVPVENTIPTVAAISPIVKEEVAVSEVENWWENWYQENNINLLLYIGAFLIVSSAAIFVGFNWESFTGVFKAFVLSLITLGFFLSGFFFYYQTPKLKNAGSTFLAIGSLLLPFNGLAWYNFVFRDLGVGFGAVWLVTSILAALVYFSLAVLLRNRFYTYIAGLGTLSLVEALVNVSALNARFYVLGGIFSAFTLMAGSKALAATKKAEFEQLYSEPLNISSQITMPIFLVWGLSIAATQSQLFTLEATLSTVLASLFYLLTFTIKRNVTYLVLSELLVMMGLVLGLKTLGFEGAIVYAFVLVSGLLLQVVAFFIKQERDISYYTIFTVSFTSILALAFTLIDPLVSSREAVFLTIAVGGLNALSFLIQKEPSYLYLTIGSLDLAAFVYVNSVNQSGFGLKNLGLIYFGSAALLQILLLIKKNISQNLRQVIVHASYLNLGLAVLFNFNSAENILLIALLTFLISAILKYSNKESEPVFAATTANGLGILAFVSVLVLPDYKILDQVYFASILSSLAFLSAYMEKKSEYLFIALASLNIGLYIKLNNAGFGDLEVNYLTFTFLLLGLIQYCAGVFLWKKSQYWSIPVLIFSAINLALAVCFAFPSEGLSLLVSAAIAFVGISAVYFLKREEFGYLGAVFACISLVNLFRFLNLPAELYPIGFVVLSYCFYLTSLISLPQLYKDFLKNSGLIIGMVNPIIFGLYPQFSSSNNYYYDNNYQLRTTQPSNNTELYALISAYLTTLMLAIEAYRTKLSQYGYFASAAGLLTVLWHFKFLEIDEIQVYSITTAVYLLIVSYTREKFGKPEERQLFDFIGLFTLFAPALFQALPETGFWFAILLGVEGLVLFFAGLSTNYKIYTYAGVTAIAVATLTRVYSFIASLGSWAIIGSLGIIFLSVAVYLLSKRKLE